MKKKIINPIKSTKVKQARQLGRSKYESLGVAHIWSFIILCLPLISKMQMCPPRWQLWSMQHFYIVSEAKKKSYPLSETCLTYLSYFLYDKIVVRGLLARKSHVGSCQTVHNKISFLTKRNDATIIFFSSDHTFVWLDTVSYCCTNSLAIEYTFFEELFAAIILIFMKCTVYHF